MEFRGRYKSVPSSFFLTLWYFLIASVSLVLSAIIAEEYFNIKYLLSPDFKA